MTSRGLYFCAKENCILAPEVWRDLGDKKKIGLCQKHAIEQGWILKPAPKIIQEKKKSLLNELLDEIAAGKIVEFLPPVREIKSQFSIDGQPSDLPF